MGFQGCYIGKATIEPPADAACQAKLSIPTLPIRDPADEIGCGMQGVKTRKVVAPGQQIGLAILAPDTPVTMDHQAARGSDDDDIAPPELLYHGVSQPNAVSTAE